MIDSFTQIYTQTQTFPIANTAATGWVTLNFLRIDTTSSRCPYCCQWQCVCSTRSPYAHPPRQSRLKRVKIPFFIACHIPSEGRRLDAPSTRSLPPTRRDHLVARLRARRIGHWLKGTGRRAVGRRRTPMLMDLS